ncbi:LytR C-terminal domain-containing protein [Actinomyces sp. ICM39]|uniref:LytR C-terminal domain-containing protein n=1 Tax=Actinomyces sp. ICM39 TaxID=1105029 RepID=UPI0005572B29|nr:MULTISPECIES: LytR C-terminal domain-containing protein [Actinomycetaceae]
MPVGMHRPKPSRWKNVWPFLAILVIVPALGWAAATALSRQQTTTPSSTPTAVSTAPSSSASPNTAPTADATASADPTPSASSSSSSASAEPDHGAVIQVLNGTGTQGYAGQQAQILNQAGYAGTSAANADGWTTQTSTVFYEDPRMEGTAKDIASKLGISSVRQESGLGDPDIVVILR